MKTVFQASGRSKLMATALEHGDTVGKGMVVTRAEVLADVQSFVVSSYKLGYNPLQHLRRMFNLFTWRHVGLSERETPEWSDKFRLTISAADLFWHIPYKDGHPGYSGLVIARIKDVLEKAWRYYASGRMKDLYASDPNRASMYERYDISDLRPFDVSEMVVARQTPTFSPPYFVSMGSGKIPDANPRQIEKIWYLAGGGGRGWVLTLNGEPGMYHADQFMSALEAPMVVC